MATEIYTYPISAMNRFVMDELIYYDAYRRIGEIFGEEVAINIVSFFFSHGESQKIRKMFPHQRVLRVENYMDSINSALSKLYNERKLKIEKKVKYYCEKCDKYYDTHEIKWGLEIVTRKLTRVRIGKKLYFVAPINEGETPIAVSIQRNGTLLLIDMGSESWIAPQVIRDLLIKDLEVPQEFIHEIKSGELRKKYNLKDFVILGENPTGFIIQEKGEEMELRGRIPSYTIIYSFEKTIRIGKCPVCGSTLMKTEYPVLVVAHGKEKIVLSSYEGEYKIPLLYCRKCGYSELGVKVKECPVCGGIMSPIFYLDTKFVPSGLYLKETRKPSLMFLHQKRQSLLYLYTHLFKSLQRNVFEKTVILRHEPPEIIDEDSRAVLLFKKKGGVTDSDLQKVKKLKRIIENLINYLQIYGETEHLMAEDNWILYEVEKVKKSYAALLKNMDLPEAFQRVYKFVLSDFSRFYIPMKRKMPIVKSPLIDALVMLYPYIPEFASKQLERLGIKERKLQLNEVKEEIQIDVVKEIVRGLRKYRNQRGIPRREPLKKVYFVSDLADQVSDFSSGIIRMENLLHFSPTERWEEMELEIVPDMEAISKSYRALAPKIAFLLRRKNVKEIMDAMNKGGYSLGVEGFIIKITPNMLKYVEKMPQGYEKITLPHGTLYINNERDITTERLRFVNEIIRRINEMRKEIDMEYDDLIDASISGDERIVREVRVYAEDIRSRCRIRNIYFKYVDFGFVVTWPIMGRKVTIGINPLFKKWVIKAFKSIPGVAENKAEALFQMGYASVYELMQASPAEIAEIPGFSRTFAQEIKDYIYSHAFKPRKIGNRSVCPFCGTVLEEDDIFCPRCGAPIRVELREKEVKGGKVYISFGDFQKLLARIPEHLRDEKKLLITKEDPQQARQIYGLKNTHIIWISYVPLGRSIKPRELEKLRKEIENFAGKGVGIILIDCFDFLMAINEMSRIQEFLTSLREIARKNGILVLFNVEEMEEETSEEIIKYVDGRL